MRLFHQTHERAIFGSILRPSLKDGNVCPCTFQRRRVHSKAQRRETTEGNSDPKIAKSERHLVYTLGASSSYLVVVGCVRVVLYVYGDEHAVAKLELCHDDVTVQRQCTQMARPAGRQESASVHG